MAATTVASGFTNISAIAYSEARHVAVVAERSGQLTLLDLLRPDDDGFYETRTIGSGYASPTHLAIDGTRIIVADDDGLWSAPLSHADRSAATAFANIPRAVKGLAIVQDAGAGALAVLDALPSPHLDVYSLGAAPGAAPGTTVRTAVADVPGGLGLAAAGGGTVHVLAGAPGGSTVQAADLALGTLRTLTPQPLAFAGPIAPLAPGWAVVTAPGGQPAIVGDGVVRLAPDAGPSPSPIGAATAAGGTRLLLAAGDRVLEAALPIGIADRVLLTMDEAPLFIGGYAPVRVDTAGSGLAFDDLRLSVDNRDLGAVSPSRDDTFDPAAPHVLMTGGWLPGRGTVVARSAATGETVGRAEFTVTDRWDGRAEGPAFSVTGACDAPVVRPAWGGGGAGPQNVDVYKAPAAWRVAIVLLDTSTNRYPAGAAAQQPVRDDWRNAMTAGVTAGGVTRSVVDFYREVSYGKLTMSLVGNDIAGVVGASGSWDDYFEVETKPDPANPGGTLPRRWNPKPDTWRAFASALEQANAANAAATPPRPPVVDLAQTDAVAFVVRTVNRPDPAVMPPTSTSIGRYVWPQQLSPTVTLSSGDRTLPMLMMPEDWTAIDGRQIYETLAHELGHTLSLPDLYLYDWMNQGLAQHQLNHWDLMHRDRGLPHLSLPLRMALGWVRPEEVRSFNFAANGGGAVLAPVTLQALERASIPANSLRGVEIRIAQGRNYYFEYRSRVAGSLGDGSLPKAQVVVGTDVVSPEGAQNYDSRTMVMRLNDDADGVDDSDGVLTQGAFLGVGQDYREKDFTEGAPKDFVATVQAVRPESADLQIRYNSEAKPELSIRTWPNGDKQWQSPDIEVRNAKSDADSKWLNVPWGGNPNRVVAKVLNHGGLDAKDVRATFSIKNLTTNADDQPPAALEPLGLSQPVTIPAGQVRELEVPWVAPTSGHYCITVDIPLYEEPGDPAIHESSDRDNWAQSNYDQFWSESGSPSARKRFTIKLENPTDATAVIFPRVRQTLPYYRTYVEHSWVRLPAKQTREIEVMTESLDGDPSWASLVDANRSHMWEVANTLEISGWMHGVCVAQCTGGASLEVRSGRGTVLDGIRFYPEPGASGVVRRSDGTTADHGTVLLTARRDEADVEHQLTATADVRADGTFFVYLRELRPGMLVSLHYLGGYGLAPCETGWMRFEY
ncbi:hypothetical protein SCMU_10870 [Sinomonas cyclohexanicum]|uniref:M6 family metalloprotease domain-containing protein n=1 Tax=Sinomonas cyclohexanicum TaxID=322009 RepID=A0ABN6FFA6_SINCY|nr:hypothetical protein [Corynebacterium cyclohexanicum]BCT75245.1 hypothetical protein SCMU_10870 [Corynebacterium cyclohexanicum]